MTFKANRKQLEILYTTLPHNKLKYRLKGLTRKYFADLKSYVVLGYKFAYFSKTSQNGKVCYAEKQICDKIGRAHV